MYQTTITMNFEPLNKFISKYQHQEKFLAYCKKCKNYNSLWSCPPLQLDTNQFLANYNYIYVVGVKVIYDAQTIHSADTPEKIKEITAQSLQEVKSRVFDNMLDLESHTPDSLCLAVGGCSICQHCSRLDQLPCRVPEKMRHSLDSFGFDLTAITSDLLQIELKWPKGSLPEYYTLVYALLTKNPVDAKAFKKLNL